MDELTVVADPHGEMFQDVGVAVLGIAHQLGLEHVVDDVDTGSGDLVRGVALAERGRVGRDLLPVLVDQQVVRVDVGLHHLVAADGEVAGHVAGAVGAVGELQPVDVGLDVHLGVLRPVPLGPEVQRPQSVVMLDPHPGTGHLGCGGDGDVLGDLLHRRPA